MVRGNNHHELAQFIERQREERSKAKDPKKICWNCHATDQTVSLRKCQGCEKMRYCSKKCAEADWKWHKDFCRKRQKKKMKKRGRKAEEKEVVGDVRKEKEEGCRVHEWECSAMVREDPCKDFRCSTGILP